MSANISNSPASTALRDYTRWFLTSLNLVENSNNQFRFSSAFSRVNIPGLDTSTSYNSIDEVVDAVVACYGRGGNVTDMAGGATGSRQSSV